MQGREELGELVLVFELFDASGGIHDLLRTGEEGVTLVADVDGEFGLVGANDKLVAAGTGNFTLHIFGMDSFFHLADLFSVVFVDGQPTHSDLRSSIGGRPFRCRRQGALQRDSRDNSPGDPGENSERYYIEVFLGITELKS